MAYSERIKNFDRILDYMRQFYVCGFKSRAEYDKKSARSYDNERRRVESWLGDFMCFRQSPDGKRFSCPWTAAPFPEIRYERYANTILGVEGMHVRILHPLFLAEKGLAKQIRKCYYADSTKTKEAFYGLRRRISPAP